MTLKILRRRLLCVKEIIKNTDNPQGLRLQIRKDRLPFYQKVAEKVEESVIVIAQEGEQYTDKSGKSEKIINVESGFVGIEIGIFEHQILSKFWKEFNRLERNMLILKNKANINNIHNKY